MQTQTEALNFTSTTHDAFRFNTWETIRDGKTVYLGKRIKSTPKGRMSDKIEWYHSFPSPEARAKKVNYEIECLTKWEEEKAKRKAAKSEAKKNIINPYKMGDVLYDSWGYDQTNIDFYQVTQVGTKSIKIREVAQIYTEAAGDMSEYVAPDINNFTEPEVTKVLQVLSSGKVYVKSRHGWINTYDGTPKYQSHYA